MRTNGRAEQGSARGQGQGWSSCPECDTDDHGLRGRCVLFTSEVWECSCLHRAEGGGFGRILTWLNGRRVRELLFLDSALEDDQSSSLNNLIELRPTARAAIFVPLDLTPI